MKEPLSEKIRCFFIRVSRFWHKHDCCDNYFKNCKKCCEKNGYEYW